jgi:serine/threonine protein kinase
MFTVDDEGNDTVNGYTLWQELGRGAAGTVYLAFQSGTDETRAVKRVVRAKAAASAQHGLLDEVALMEKVKHPHVVRLYECIDDPGASHVYLVMQYVAGGPIAKLSESGTCPPMPLPTVAHYAAQLASALCYMHGEGVTHGDIKPDNILVDVQAGDKRAYFADFGVSRAFQPRRRRDRSPSHAPLSPLRSESPGDGSGEASSLARDTAAGRSMCRPLGTPLFLAPEVFQGDEPGAPADVWALGVTLFALVYGRLPFSGGSYGDVRRAVLSEDVKFPHAVPAARPWRSLLLQLLHKDPVRRMAAKGLRRSALLASPHAPSAVPGVLGCEQATQTSAESIADALLSAAWA